MSERVAPERTGEHGAYTEAPDEEEFELIRREGEPILSVQDLRTHFDTDEGTVKADDGVSFEIEEGEILGLVGESGCGKSVTSLSIMRLLQSPGYIADGRIMFRGEDLATKTKEEMRQIRGNRMAMIFQEPMTAMNPVFDIGWQVGEPLRIHQEMSRSASRTEAIELMRRVGIPSPEDRIDDYPHQFSGGMRQRAMIAMALACEPDLLVADEPTTALDVTIQAQILDLIRELNDRLGMSVLLITHNLGVVAETCDRVAVMYAGRIVEYGTVDEIFNDPRHPYTKGLINAVPDPTRDEQELQPITGNVPSLADTPDGCNFAPRCPYATEQCQTDDPRLREVDDEHYSACIWEDPL
jgi:oligopeptide/dipeptide ABC transporter ATP-binding protein